MFLGQYYHAVDEKGRMTVPAGFRDVFDDGLYITQGFDKNLVLLTESVFHTKAEKVIRMSETNPKSRKLRRLFFATAGRVELDRLGRVLIPQFLRDFAGLENDAVIVGAGNVVEIWSPTVWKEQLEDLTNSEVNAEQFMEHDL
jgi:MraZ protein